MLSLCTLLLAAAGGALTPDHLRCEYRVDPLGIDAPKPRLSWIVTSKQPNERQSAYEIHVSRRLDILKGGSGEVWNSGKVSSDETVGVEYGGAPLGVGDRLYWTVTVWDAEGRASATSKPATWEIGTNRATWQGQWISKASIPCPYFRKEFSSRGPVTRARLYATARGLYRVSIDGKPVGKGELTPGWSDFNKRATYQTYDVTDMVKPGKHAIGMRLGTGWFSGHVAWRDSVYGKYPLGMAMLEIDYADGRAGDFVRTDGSWKAGAGPVKTSDLLMGEECDARVSVNGWDKPGFDDSQWSAPDVTADDDETLTAQRGPMVEKLVELKTQSVTEPKPGSFVFDLGQNMVGWARLKVRGPAGAQVTLRFAEVLNKDGTIYTTNLRKAKATDVYTLSGKGTETYEPSFTFHGFRYVEVTGYPGRPDASSITGVVVGSNIPRTGSFECSNELVNKLQHNIEWGMRGNYVDIPTDCPQRDERLGWMGDAETFAPTATFIGDIDGFMTKWTQDVDDAQTKDGAFTDVSPNILGPEGAPAWGDAGVIVPWDVYLAYGDTRLLDRNYPHMKAWVDRIDRYNPDHLWLKHRGNDYGDWLNVQDETPKDLVATAFYYNSAFTVGQAAAELGHLEDAERYLTLASAVEAAFLTRYLQPENRLTGDSQTAYVLALAFGMADNRFHSHPKDMADSMKREFGDRLVGLIQKRDWHLSTGFVGVGRLMQALTMTGHADVAEKLLLQTTYPSWLYPVTQGATTIWERWDGYRADKGFQDPGMNSFNHYAMGAVGDWMYASLAGIGQEFGSRSYRKIVIEPHVTGGITWAKATLDSVMGHIESAWKLEGDVFTLDVTIPANTTATVVLPGARRVENKVGSGRHHFTANLK